jgi:transposase-like protein
MTERDIQAHLQDMYGVEVSAELVSRVTDSILTEVREWRDSRCLPPIPSCILMRLRVNSRKAARTRTRPCI